MFICEPITYAKRLPVVTAVVVSFVPSDDTEPVVYLPVVVVSLDSECAVVCTGDFDVLFVFIDIVVWRVEVNVVRAFVCNVVCFVVGFLFLCGPLVDLVALVGRLVPKGR